MPSGFCDCTSHLTNQGVFNFGKAGRSFKAWEMGLVWVTGKPPEA